MRAYFFGNSTYMSSIQQGIQSTHCMAEMYQKYLPQVPATHKKAESVNQESVWQIAQMSEWATYHKTVILMNAGSHKNINDLHEFFKDKSNKFPFAAFAEGNDELNGATTCTGIILMPKIYLGAKKLRSRLPPGEDTDWQKLNTLTIDNDGDIDQHKYSKWEIALMKKLNTFKLA